MKSSSGLMRAFHAQMYPRGFLQSPSGLPLMHEGHIRVHIPASFVASRQNKDCNYSLLLINCFSWHQMWTFTLVMMHLQQMVHSCGHHELKLIFSKFIQLCKGLQMHSKHIGGQIIILLCFIYVVCKQKAYKFNHAESKSSVKFVLFIQVL